MMDFKWNGILLVLLAVLITVPSAVTSLDIAYCSPQNTGSDFDAVSDKYQSNGACYNSCVAKYAFAVLQGKNCWCSNFIPAATKSKGSCNQKCPGYPDDKCGSTSDNLFAYFALDEKPSGTATGGSPPTTKTTLAVSNDPDSIRPSGDSGTPISLPVPISQHKVQFHMSTQTTTLITVDSQILTTIIQSTTSTAEPETETVTVAPSSLESLTTTTLSTSSTSSSKKSEPSTTTTDSGDVSVTTRAGEIVTITVGNGQPAETAGSEGEKKDEGSSLSGGAIAGIIIGVIAVVGSAFGVWLWFFCARRRREDDSLHSPEAHLDPTVPPSALYNGNHRGNRSSQMSMSNRFSVPAFTDNRMKKDAVIYGNGARESNISLQDNQDYSRPVLRLANPDP